MQFSEAAVGCILAGRHLAGGSVEMGCKTALGHLEPMLLSGHSQREEAGRVSSEAHPGPYLPALARAGPSTQGHESREADPDAPAPV